MQCLKEASLGGMLILSAGVGMNENTPEEKMRALIAFFNNSCHYIMEI